jgi:hypothetical protein
MIIKVGEVHHITDSNYLKSNESLQFQDALPRTSQRELLIQFTRCQCHDAHFVLQVFHRSNTPNLTRMRVSQLITVYHPEPATPSSHPVHAKQPPRLGCHWRAMFSYTTHIYTQVARM